MHFRKINKRVHVNVATLVGTKKWSSSGFTSWLNVFYYILMICLEYVSLLVKYFPPTTKFHQQLNAKKNKEKTFREATSHQIFQMLNTK